MGALDLPLPPWQGKGAQLLYMLWKLNSLISLLTVAEMCCDNRNQKTRNLIWTRRTADTGIMRPDWCSSLCQQWIAHCHSYLWGCIACAFCAAQFAKLAKSSLDLQSMLPPMGIPNRITSGIYEDWCQGNISMWLLKDWCGARLWAKGHHLSRSNKDKWGKAIKVELWLL